MNDQWDCRDEPSLANLFRRECDGPRISTALLLAAGVGHRLRPLTQTVPKCLTEVNGVSILGRLVRNLTENGIKKLVVVVGHLDHCIRNFLSTCAEGLDVQFVHNPQYASTNNILSLWLARTRIRAPFLLVESDLLFDPGLLSGMLVPDRVAVARLGSGMSGTTVSLDARGFVDAFSVGGSGNGRHNLKTVNIYSLSRRSWGQVLSCLETRISAGRLQDYYEVVFAQLVAEGRLHFQGHRFDQGCWIEVDTIEDLRAAEALFGQPRRRQDGPEQCLPQEGL